jgi:hypothetical protein
MTNYYVHDEAIDLKVHTKRPGKWILIDTETGQVYKGTASGYWEKIGEPEDVKKDN